MLGLERCTEIVENALGGRQAVVGAQQIVQLLEGGVNGGAVAGGGTFGGRKAQQIIQQKVLRTAVRDVEEIIEMNDGKFYFLDSPFFGR